MFMVFKIALRNIFRHSGKTFVIGIILFLGSLIMTFGNSVIAGMENGLKNNLIESLTGDIVLVSTNQKQKTGILYGGGINPAPLEVLGGYNDIKNLLLKTDFIDKFLPAGRNFINIYHNNGETSSQMFMAVDFNEYQNMFHSNSIIIEGEELEGSRKGIILSHKNRKLLYNINPVWYITAKDGLIEDNMNSEAHTSYNKNSLTTSSKIIVEGTTFSTKDISVPVIGIFKLNSLDSSFGGYNYIDIESYRETFNYVTASDNTAEISEENIAVLNIDSDNIATLFNENLISDVKLNNKSYDIKNIQIATKKTETDVNLDNGSYNIVMIKLKKGVSIDWAVKKLNDLFKNNETDAVAVDFETASGLLGQMSSFFKITLNVFIIFTFFVAIIIIMNTLSMSAMERINELGMMRAIGADKRFLTDMFLIETFLISFIFGGIGILLGFSFDNIISMLHIAAPSDNELLQLLFGGDYFSPMLMPIDFLWCIVLLLIVTIISIIYPISIANKITPLDAISRE